MSTITTPNDSPIQPLHNLSQAAQVVVPKAPLGNVANQAPGMGAKALLAKKLAKSNNPTYISPTDNLMTPVTQKLNAAKKKHFEKGAKPVQPFAQKESGESSSDEERANDVDVVQTKPLEADDENPF
ncbi:hypothetical protein BDQ17DRAFT_1423312 [Cyathus striatus]|nr:hypothetical protein BDQ17DRAFT_1423312 [Cyathus striatus]